MESKSEQFPIIAAYTEKRLAKIREHMCCLFIALPTVVAIVFSI